MKKKHIKNIKKYTRKEKKEMKDGHCNGEKVLEFLSMRKSCRTGSFCFNSAACVWNLASSHQAPYENLQCLECWRSSFCFFFWRISSTNFNINQVSHFRFWHLHSKRPYALNFKELWRWWASSIVMNDWRSRKEEGLTPRNVSLRNILKWQIYMSDSLD